MQSWWLHNSSNQNDAHISPGIIDPIIYDPILIEWEMDIVVRSQASSRLN